MAYLRRRIHHLLGRVAADVLQDYVVGFSFLSSFSDIPVGICRNVLPVILSLVFVFVVVLMFSVEVFCYPPPVCIGRDLIRWFPFLSSFVMLPLESCWPRMCCPLSI